SCGQAPFRAGRTAGSRQGGGPAGVAPGASLVDLKVAGADGATTLGQVPAGLQLADAARERFNLRILNVSLGARAPHPPPGPPRPPPPPQPPPPGRSSGSGPTEPGWSPPPGTTAAGSTPPGS